MSPSFSDRDLVLTKKKTMYSKYGDTFFYVILLALLAFVLLNFTRKGFKIKNE